MRQQPGCAEEVSQLQPSFREKSMPSTTSRTLHIVFPGLEHSTTSLPSPHHLADSYPPHSPNQIPQNTPISLSFHCHPCHFLFTICFSYWTVSSMKMVTPGVAFTDVYLEPSSGVSVKIQKRSPFLKIFYYYLIDSHPPHSYTNLIMEV